MWGTLRDAWCSENEKSSKIETLESSSVDAFVSVRGCVNFSITWTKPLHHTITYLHSTSHSLISPRIIDPFKLSQTRKEKLYLQIYLFFWSENWEIEKKIKKKEREEKREMMKKYTHSCLVIRGLRLILQARYKNTRSTIFYNYTIIIIVCSYTITIEFVFNKRQVPWLH